MLIDLPFYWINGLVGERGNFLLYFAIEQHQVLRHLNVLCISILSQIINNLMVIITINGQYLLYIIHYFILHMCIFRAQEPKAPVTYCDHALSGVCRPSSVCPSSVRLFTFSTSSPEPLDGFWWNLVWMKYSRSLTSVVVFRPDPSRGGSRAGQK